MANVKKFIMSDGTEVEIPSGGSEEWELINTVTVEDGAEEATNFYFDKDSSGKTFSLKHALLLYYFPKYEGEKTVPTFFFFDVNGVTSGPNAPLMYTSAFAMPGKTATISGWAGIDFFEEGSLRKEYRGYSNSTGVFNGMTNTVKHEQSWYGRRANDTDVHRIGFVGGLVYAGCIFELWGVRK